MQFEKAMLLTMDTMGRGGWGGGLEESGEGFVAQHTKRGASQNNIIFAIDNHTPWLIVAMPFMQPTQRP